MDLKRILVAINSPNGRDAAFERALALARSSGAELYLLHAVPVNDGSRSVRPSGWSGWRTCAGARRTPACACKQSNNTATPQKSSSSMPTRVRWT